MQAKILKWTSRSSFNKIDNNTNNDDETDFRLNIEQNIDFNKDAAIPFKKPLPLKRVNATFNLMENRKVINKSFKIE